MMIDLLTTLGFGALACAVLSGLVVVRTVGKCSTLPPARAYMRAAGNTSATT